MKGATMDLGGQAKGRSEKTEGANRGGQKGRELHRVE